ncbi:MAG: hypothetical protein JXR94_13050 [Candidatus Hydrogenedentes bacterium]|nr:hypothetical protein [Candidatus Hydrogenedentota bacterium]
MNRIYRRNWLVVASAVLLVAAAAAFAQEAQPGPPEGGQGHHRGRRRLPSPEEAQAVWALQSAHVADVMQLSAEQAGQLATAYTESRKRLWEVFRQKHDEMREQFRGVRSRMDEPGQMPRHLTEGEREELREAISEFLDEMMEAMMKAAAKERDTFRTALSAFLSEEQANTAVERLGSFCGMWDYMVHTIAEFRLGEKQAAALEAANVYIVEYFKLREFTASDSDEDFAELCETLTGITLTRDRAMAELLNEEQLEQWKKAVAPRPAPGEGPGRGRRPGEEDK